MPCYAYISQIHVILPSIGENFDFWGIVVEKVAEKLDHEDVVA